MQEYPGVFNCYFSIADECKETKFLYDISNLEPISTKIMILDKHAEPSVLNKSAHYKPDQDQSYFKKYQMEIFLIQEFEESIKKLIEAYMDDKVRMTHIS